MTRELTAKQRRKRKNAILRRRLFLLLLALIVIISVCLFTPIFNIKSVEVTGNEQILSEKILEIAAIPDGINMFKVNKRKVQNALLQIPEIESVRIRRVLPPKIRLEITETRAALLFPYMRGYVATDVNGKAMAHFEIPDGLNLVQITGAKINTAEICEKISVQDEVTFDIIMETVASLQKADLLDDLRSAHFDNLADIHFYTKEGVKVIIGKTEELDYKLTMLSTVLPQVNRIEGSYIDLTTPSRTVYGTIDETPTEEEVPEGTEAESNTEENKETAEAKPEEPSAA